MLGSLPSLKKKHLGAPLQSRKAMLETLFRHLDMVRLSAGALMMLAAASCTGLIDGGSDGKSEEQKNAQELWEKDAYPVVKDACNGCHNGSRANIGFLEDASMTADGMREKLMAYTPSVVNLDAPSSSRLVSKGLHDGPAFTAEESGKVVQWLQAEKTARDHDPLNPVLVIKAGPVAMQLCTGGLPDNAAGTCPTNHVSLDAVANAGITLAGAELSFTAQTLAASNSLYITNLKLVGGTSGANIEYPLFVSVPEGKDPYPDQIDRFFSLKSNVAAGATELLGGGTHSFAGFVPTDKIEIHFKAIKAFKADTGGGGGNTGGCKSLATFKTNVAAQVQASCAAACHSGGQAGAKGAMDTTGINSADDATLAIACAQVLTRANLVNTAQSGLYLAPDPASNTNHPFKFANTAAFTAFQTSVDVWVQAEKKAP